MICAVYVARTGRVAGSVRITITTCQSGNGEEWYQGAVPGGVPAVSTDPVEKPSFAGKITMSCTHANRRWLLETACNVVHVILCHTCEYSVFTLVMVEHNACLIHAMFSH